MMGARTARPVECQSFQILSVVMLSRMSTARSRMGNTLHSIGTLKAFYLPALTLSALVETISICLHFLNTISYLIIHQQTKTSYG